MFLSSGKHGSREAIMDTIWRVFRRLHQRCLYQARVRRGRADARLAVERLEDRALLSYSVTDLGTIFGARISHGYAINESGQIAGDFAPSPDWVVHACIFSNGTLTNLGTLGGAKSQGFGINAGGQVVGSSTTAAGDTHAFLYSDEAMTDLGTLGGDSSEADAINTDGISAGIASTVSGVSHGFLDTDGTMTDIGTLGGPSSRVTALNDAGQIAGYSATAEGVIHAFGPNGGNMVDLGTLGGNNSFAYALNAFGDVVGTADTLDGCTHAFVFHNGFMSDLGAISGFTKSYAYGINDAGMIVGDLHGVGDLGRPFLYDRGLMRNLNDLVPPDTGFTLLSARAINNAGQITGWGRYIGSTPDHAVLLTPDRPELPLVNLGPNPHVVTLLPGQGSSVLVDHSAHSLNVQAVLPSGEMLTTRPVLASVPHFIVTTAVPSAEPDALSDVLIPA
jgi:probable HAF family extracellular repeat protein